MPRTTPHPRLRLHLCPATGGATNLLHRIEPLRTQLGDAVEHGYRTWPGTALARSSFGPVLGEQRPEELVLDVSGTPVEAIEIAVRIIGAVGEEIDASRSLVLVGEEHAVLPGDGPVAFAFLLRRRAALDHRAFLDYWRNQHTRRAVPGLAGYRQLHVEPASTAAASRRLGFPPSDLDGVATAFYRDETAFLEVSAGPAIAVDARRDERRFIDHARSGGALWSRIESSATTPPRR